MTPPAFITQPQSFVWPIEVALAAAINADATLATLLAGDRVYSLWAPPNAPFDYITLGDVNESASSRFHRPGTITNETLHLWSRAGGKQGVAAIYAALVALLDGNVLALSDGRMLRGRMELTTVLADPDGKTAHGVARYTVLAEVTG